MTTTPQDDDGFRAPPQAEDVQEGAMDEVLDSYTEAIDDSPDAGESHDDT